MRFLIYISNYKKKTRDCFHFQFEHEKDNHNIFRAHITKFVIWEFYLVVTSIDLDEGSLGVLLGCNFDRPR